MLDQPHTLTSVKKGHRLNLISVHGLPNPLHVTDDYCGSGSSGRSRRATGAGPRFPDAPPDAKCGGIQQLQHL